MGFSRLVEYKSLRRIFWLSYFCSLFNDWTERRATSASHEKSKAPFFREQSAYSRSTFPTFRAFCSVWSNSNTSPNLVFDRTRKGSSASCWGCGRNYIALCSMATLGRETVWARGSIYVALSFSWAAQFYPALKRTRSEWTNLQFHSFSAAFTISSVSQFQKWCNCSKRTTEAKARHMF